MGRFIKHIACDKCGSSDGCAVYDDNSTYCFVCKHNTMGDGKYEREPMTGHIDTSQIDRLPCVALEDRKISEETAKLYRVHTEFDQNTGEPKIRYAALYKDGQHQGYHKRTLPMDCRVVNGRDTDPFGAHVAGNGGKFLIVVEGVEDALAAYEMLKEQGKNYRVVATLGTDRWRKQLDYIDRFEKVVIAFDMDSAGKVAAGELSVALGAGKAFIANWPARWNDPSDMHIDGKSKQFLHAIFNAEEHKPDGVLYGEEAWDRIKDYVAPEFVPFPPEFEQLNEKSQGMRRGEISLWCAGTGSGKTSYIRRIKQHIVTNHHWKVGEIELEEKPEKTIRGMLQFQAKKRMVEMTPEEKRAAHDATYGSGKLFCLDHRSRNSKGANLMSKIKYMHYGLGCDIIFLDHITLAVSEFGDGNGLADQDRMMNEFLAFVETTNTHLALISHLRKSPGGSKSFEEGAIPREDDLKGSGSLKQISFDIYGLSRNKHHPDEYERDVSQVHVLKCRETGDTGPADRMYWDVESQSLTPAAEPEDIYGDDDEL